MTDKQTAEYASLGIKATDKRDITFVAWRENMTIVDLIPIAVKVFANATETERAEILSRREAK